MLFRTVTDALGPTGPRHAPTTSRLTKSGKFWHCKRAKRVCHVGELVLFLLLRGRPQPVYSPVFYFRSSAHRTKKKVGVLLLPLPEVTHLLTPEYPPNSVATQQDPFVSDALSHAIKINACMMSSRLTRLPSSPPPKLVGSCPGERHCQAIFPTPGYHKSLASVKIRRILTLTRLRHRPNSIIPRTEERMYLKVHLHEVCNLLPPPPLPLYNRSRNTPATLHPASPPPTTDPTHIMTETVPPVHPTIRMRPGHLLSSVRQNLSHPRLCLNRPFRTLAPPGEIRFRPIQLAHIIPSRTLA